MDKKTFWEKCKRPRGWFLVLLYLATVAVIAGALVILFVDYAGTPLEIVAYALFGLAACLLAYSVYTVVIYFPAMKAKLMGWIRSYPVFEKLLDDFSLRTVVFAVGSLAITVAYSAYNGVIAIIYRSGWYGSLALYYILLVALRGGISLYHGKRRKVREGDEVVELKKYRSCGWLLIATILALAASVVQMVLQDKGAHYSEIMIYVAATYTFTKITLAIVNAVKAKKEKTGYTILALRNVSLADAAVSLLSLQTAMFHIFGEPSKTTQLANALTGGAVCLFVVALGVLMLVRANKAKKRMKMTKQEENE